MEISAKKTLDGKRDYLPVARTLRDKLDGLITFGDIADLGTQRKILLDVSQELALFLADNATHRYDEICTCARRDHERIMNPGLWSTLPMELLQCVFAKLPIPDICRLKSLSKEWQLSLQSSSSEFTLALKESSPKILARVSLGRYSDFQLRVLNGRDNQWHKLHVNVEVGPGNHRMIELFPAVVERWVHMNGAADAGLVCYVEKENFSGSNRIYVTNPMTGFVNRLPANLNSELLHSELTMMRIVVDPDTYHYKVIVVKSAPPVEAEVYDSEVRQWTKPDPSLGRIFGIAHSWNQDEDDDVPDGVWSAQKVGPCAYDSREGKYYDFKQDQEKWLGEYLMSYTLMKDRLFVLYLDQKKFEGFISEYCVPDNATSWVKVETHDCSAWWFGIPAWPWLTYRIHACSGFLFVFIEKDKYAWLRDTAAHKKHELGWVYDLSTCEWLALPGVPWGSTPETMSFLTNVVCEVHWSIQP